MLVGSNLLMLIASGMAYASMIYFLTYNLKRPDALKQIGIITLIACAAIVLSQPMWVKLASTLGKKRTYILSALAYGLLALAWAMIGRFGLGVDYILAAMLGLSNSGWSLMGFSMVSDLADDGRGGLYSSIWVSADKIGFALGGTLLVGSILAVFGFDSARAMSGLAQSPHAVTGVLLCFCIAPATLSFLAGAAMWRWAEQK